ncbi:MAG TPA: ABC transporter ATP-binding protein, partial [Trueperaceae bacterium]|nr:ABC transporter ATP-binding protein [Trueperaceae bacterium]
FYPYLTGRANLQLHASLAGGVEPGRIAEVLNLMELSDASERKVGVYSLGMRQRLGVAAAILTRPGVLILDEPASGMDPLSLHLVHSVLRKAAEEGTAVLLSTHHLDEVVAYCTRVAILEEGVLIDEVNLFDRRERYRLRPTNIDEAVRLLSASPHVKHASVRGTEVVFIPASAKDLAAVTGVLAQGGVGVLEMNRDVFDLRAYYRERVSAERARRTGVIEPVAYPGEAS